MALLGLLVLLALAGPLGATWDTCRGTCGLRPMAFDHSSVVAEYSQNNDYESLESSDGSSQDTGGSEVHPGAWPGVISVQATWENGTWHMCSGALIHPQWVLTVAHCFARAGDISRWEVVIGATDLSQPGPEAQLRHIRRLLVHQYYDEPTAWNNIALVELDQPVECSDYIQLGCVPDSSLAVTKLKTCYIAGWSHPGQRSVPARALGAGTRRAGGSAGARPGPGLGSAPRGLPGATLSVVGLASWGKGCAGAKRPGVFTATQHFHTWIQVQMGLLPPEADAPPPEPFPSPEEEPEADLEDEENPNPEDSEDYTKISFQQQILGKFLNLLLELLQFLKGEKA
ncbi:LOW QUALITY PROTEIN: acrosin-like [Pyrgilauda ruficollis]|uniref:LOW QUALITY PROTEIN: acrosin-like n=1 Tax=Pyrgilauda ruficollis TaxID=221976 RepID=UPI001B85B7E6|nr:LOW QUALITY PROTEIN: acrosin-like [Pyrgilauda ruficollis]